MWHFEIVIIVVVIILSPEFCFIKCCTNRLFFPIPCKNDFDLVAGFDNCEWFQKEFQDLSILISFTLVMISPFRFQLFRPDCPSLLPVRSLLPFQPCVMKYPGMPNSSGSGLFSPFSAHPHSLFAHLPCCATGPSARHPIDFYERRW